MKHILSSGLVAGLAAGLLCALLQYLLVQPEILLAERYESGELTHFQGVAAGNGVVDHSMDGMDMGAEAPATRAGKGAQTPAHGQSDAGMSPGQRQALTVLFAVLTYAGYGLILAAGMAAAEQSGVTIGRSQAILWGLCGFLAFQLLPALGLAPELPGTPAASLDARQAWWAGTALASILGLGLLGYGKGVVARLIGIAALAVPHVVGAPQLDGFGGIVPPELSSAFAARTLAVGLATWAVLGLCVQLLWHSERA